ncbi:MAG: sarcosine oxidase subunit gamma [Hyphomicrobiales bacterium]|nr:sarcosine oxidase subunit gamma [Hyphomicrobiales bacterium]
MRDMQAREFNQVTVSTPQLAGRTVVRCARDTMIPSLAALGIAAPPAINRAASGDALSLLRLGPDEWLALSAVHHGAELFARLSDALGPVPSSLVDVTQRQVALAVAGSGAEAALATGVPLDLAPAAFPVGMATRTIFEKSEIVLWRTAANSFHIEVWRSFAPYVMALLDAARTELAHGK